MTHTTNTKEIPCVSCPTIFRVDVGAAYVQCAPCILHDMPNPQRLRDLARVQHVESNDHQLELGEAA